MVRLFSTATSSLTSAAAVVGIFSIVSRIAGFIRDRILLSIFHAGPVLDSYYQAQRIPDLLLQLFVVGALSASFIPIFTKYYLGDDRARAWKYTSSMLVALAVGFTLISIIGIALADPLSRLIAPGFSGESQQLVASMMRILFVGQCFFSVSMVFGSVLQGAKRFVLYSFAPIVNNVGIILGAMFLAPTIGPLGLAYGAVLGGILHALIQLVGVMALGYRFTRPSLLINPDVRLTFWQMGPRVMSLAVNQVNFLLMGIIASHLVVGSVTTLNLAYTLNFFPIGVIAVSYAIAAYPTFCEKAVQNNLAALRSSLSETIRQTLFFLLPVTAVTLLLKAQIVRLVYGAPGVTWEATITVANTLGAFAFSFFAQGIVYILVRGFFALEDTRTPLLIGLASGAINIAAALILAPSLGVSGLGIAFSLAAIVQVAALWICLRPRLGGLDEARLARFLGVHMAAGVLAAIVMQIVKYAFSARVPLDTFTHVLWQTLLAGGAGLIVYGLVALALKSEEMRAFLMGIRRKFLRQARPSEVSGVI